MFSPDASLISPLIAIECLPEGLPHQVGVADIENTFVLFRTLFSSFGALDKKCVFGKPRVCLPCGIPPPPPHLVGAP